ncbi:MAG: recombination regulator RecX [Pseudomonadota bacterium]
MTGEPSLKTRALGYLARREHSRLELEKKLASHAQDPAELSAMLDALEQLGFLSARRMVEQVVQVRRKKFGSQRIVHELREKGIDEDLIAAALPELKETELDAAREVWRKKFRAPPADTTERGRQMRFLLGRGFAPGVIREVLLCPNKGEA